MTMTVAARGRVTSSVGRTSNRMDNNTTVMMTVSSTRKRTKTKTRVTTNCASRFIVLFGVVIFFLMQGWTSMMLAVQHRSSESSRHHHQPDHYEYNKYRLGPIFYNIFIPPPENNDAHTDINTDSGRHDNTQTQTTLSESQKNAIRIVEEQMKQLHMYYHDSAAAAALLLSSQERNDQGDGIGEVGNSSSSSSSTPPLLYVQIGADIEIDGYYNDDDANSRNGTSATTNSKMLLSDRWCRQHQPSQKQVKLNLNMNCRRILYLQEGGEVDTLQQLWTYCHDNPSDVVTYIHNKGAYHHTMHNEKTRRRATKAAFDCRSQLVPPSHSSSSSSFSFLKQSTNVCAGRVSLLPQYLANGNMWTAKCDYVLHLKEPRQYEHTLRRMYEDGLGMMLPPQPHSATNTNSTNSSSSSIVDVDGRRWPPAAPTAADGDIYTNHCCLRPTSMKPNHLGLGRFAFERWVWSHPDVVPADVFPSDKVMDRHQKEQRRLPDWKPSFRRSFGRNPKVMGLSETSSMFSKLQGRLFEWNYIYHKHPPSDSWVWKFYNGYDETLSGLFNQSASYCSNIQNQICMTLLAPKNTTF